MVFKLDFGQISFDLVQKAFATQQFAPLATSIPFYNIWVKACTEIKFFGQESDLHVRLQAFRLLNFYFFSSFSFSFLFAVIGLLLGFPAVKKLLRKAQQDGQI